MYLRNTVRLKNVVAPLSRVVGQYWVGDDRRRGDGIRSSCVFVKEDTRAEDADSMEAGRDEVSTKLAAVIADLIIGLLALGVEVEGRSRSNMEKKHRVCVRVFRVFVELHCVRQGVLGGRKLQGAFERAGAVKEAGQQSKVCTV
jgi:hypothetical protein